MTKAYYIVNITVTNPEGFADYCNQAFTTKTFGGKIIIRTDKATQVEGVPSGDMHVVIEFPTRNAAEAWYNSDAYQNIINLRKENTISNIILVDGYTSAL